MQIRQIDPRDEQAFNQWFEVVVAAQRAARPTEPGWILHEQRQLALSALKPDPDETYLLLAALDETATVGAARLEVPQRDNHHLCDLLLVVHPKHRRQGAGRTLLAEAERLASRLGRTTMTATSDEPPGQEGRSPSRDFGPVVGFGLSQVEVRRDIDLPLAPQLVAELTESSAPYAADYDVCTWRDAVPAALLDDQAMLLRRMSTDVPMADLEWKQEAWDGARVRRDEALTAAMDKTWFGAGALHRPTGRLVAYTTMGLARSQLERAHQWDTLVLSEHRGHRLGTLVNLACLQRLSAEISQARVISTSNAEENTPMIRVNEALGAQVNGQRLKWQRRLA